MDPLTTFGLAASVVQFITFTGGLLRKSIEIHNSASGLPNDLDIHEAYQELTALSSSLRDFTEADLDASKVDREIMEDIDSIKALGGTCKSDCETLLNVVDKLRVKDGGGRRIKSFRAAFTAFRKNGDIKRLEERLAESQRQLILYLCHISTCYHKRHTQTLEDLQQKAAALALNQHARFDSLASSLKQIKQIVTTQFEQPTVEIPKLPQVTGIESVRDLMTKLALSERDMTKEQEVLRSLLYEHYSDRYQSITPAHQKTFSWVFNPANTSSEGRRLVQWLRQGQGVFWITGKPGSGKSTMMKFLCDDAQTITALQEWAGDRKLSIVSHYFWLSGTMMQKSQEGLYRSLLYGVFQRCPELIQKVCPARWAAAGRDAGIDSQQTHWTLNELLTAFSSIPRFSQLAYRFCIFVDGLDEYQGDHVEMCATIQKLGTACEDIKVCVASRPWNDFENAFRGGRQILEMHQLTRDDIHEYAQARLTEHWAWATVAVNAYLADSLVKLILRQAEGVFLWVVLVTEEIRKSLSNYDSLEDLYRRVDGFPSNLGEFFKHILESVDPFYHAKMATSLQLTLAAVRPLQLPIYYFHEREHGDSNYALSLPISQVTEEAVEERCKIIEKRLKGWCKGLLEVQMLSGLEVHFFHRTVRDYLRTPEMAAFLKAKAPAQFSANLSIMKAYTAWLKSHTFYDQPEPVDYNLHSDFDNMQRQEEAPFNWMTMGLLSAAHQIERDQEDVSSQIQVEAFTHIDEFERSAIELEHQGKMTFESYEDDYSKDNKYAARLLCDSVFRHGLVLYLSHNIINDPDYLTISGMTCYMKAFINVKRPDTFYEGLRKGVESVLEFGEDPNKEADLGDRSSSLFATLMLGREETEGFYWEKQLIRMRLVSLFLEFGADPKASLNASGWNPCCAMVAIPLKAKSDDYDGDTFLLELDSLFDRGADSEIKMQDQDQELSDTPISAREWFFQKLQLPLDRDLNNKIIGQVALRLLRRMKDQAEADSGWVVLERALPHGIYQRIKSSVAGSKRKRDEDQQQLEDEPGRCTQRLFDTK